MEQFGAEIDANLEVAAHELTVISAHIEALEQQQNIIWARVFAAFNRAGFDGGPASFVAANGWVLARELVTPEPRFDADALESEMRRRLAPNAFAEAWGAITEPKRVISLVKLQEAVERGRLPRAVVDVAVKQGSTYYKRTRRRAQAGERGVGGR